MRRIFGSMLCMALVLAPAGPAYAQVSIDFTGIPFGTKANGLTADGVSFAYTVGGVLSDDAAVGSGPGCITYVCDPSLEGGSEGARLVMSFLNPLTAFQFGLAVNVTWLTSVDVSLFDPFGALLGTYALSLSKLAVWSEGRFDAGDLTLGSVAIDLDPSAGTRFALDNIQGRVVPVPEPATALLLATGLLGLAGAARRRNSRRD